MMKKTLQYPAAAVGIDVGGTKIAGALVLYRDNERAPLATYACSLPTEASSGGAVVLENICKVAASILERSVGTNVLGIGVGTAGCVNPEDGSIEYANEIMPGWTGQPVAATLAERFGMPCAVLGDVQAHALGEARWGAARSAASCVLVGIGTGLGGAIVVDGKVLTGAHGAAGHLGHSLSPAAIGSTCACGRRDHVEAVTSGTAIGALYQGRGYRDALDPALDGAEVARRSREGETKAQETLEFAGRALGEAIGSWCNIIDPDMVILSGSVTAAGPIWRNALEQGFRRQALVPMQDTPIVDAALGANAPVIGAAEHLLDTLGCLR